MWQDSVPVTQASTVTMTILARTISVMRQRVAHTSTTRTFAMTAMHARTQIPAPAARARGQQSRAMMTTRAQMIPATVPSGVCLRPILCLVMTGMHARWGMVAWTVCVRAQQKKTAMMTISARKMHATRKVVVRSLHCRGPATTAMLVHRWTSVLEGFAWEDRRLTATTAMGARRKSATQFWAANTYF